MHWNAALEQKSVQSVLPNTGREIVRLLFHLGVLLTNINSSFVDFRNIEDAALEELALACKPASFGKGAEEILDDSIRKAGKLDLDKFATLFTPIGTDIVDTVYDHFAFSISKGGSGYRYELYKLNVYGASSS